MNTTSLLSSILSGGQDAALVSLYGEEMLDLQRVRYAKAVEGFVSTYGEAEDASVFTVAGRSEISGNHTDHNWGCVIAASINLDIIAVAAKNGENIIRIKSEGFPEDVIDITDETVDEGKFFTSGAIISGVCKGFSDNGFAIGGYNAYTTSNVLKGSGLSSSAAFEDMVGNILNYFFNDGKIDNAEIAKISQFAENKYFGKPCGLMDQVACAVGGFVAIDFGVPGKPVIEKMDFDLSSHGYSLCIVSTGGNHADLNEDYASVPAEMKAVAAHFGKPVLREVTMEELISAIPVLREKTGDRAILRAMHFINENKRVKAQTAALKEGDLDAFFGGVLASGNSSFEYLQNVYTTKNVSEQGLSLALALAQNYLSDKGGAWRVHGGGFAGTTQAFVRNEDVPGYRALMDGAFGEGACLVLKVRAVGAGKVI
ncbi:MAG: galactokinase [Clostridia bacterium]|nr:galactokinase [Clostridia bacterium]